MNQLEEVYTELIELPHKIEFASVDCISPNFDMYGKRIRTYKKKILRRIFLTIFPYSNKSYILLSCCMNDKKVFENYFRQMKEASKYDLYKYLSVLLLLYSENVVMNPLLWDKWESEGQFVYSYLSNLVDSDLVKFERTYAFGLENKHKRNVDMPKSKCNLFDSL